MHHRPHTSNVSSSRPASSSHDDRGQVSTTSWTGKRPSHHRRRRRELSTAFGDVASSPLQFWNWARQETFDVGTLTKGDDVDIRDDEDISTKLIIGAVVCMFIMVFVALLLLIYILVHRGYILNGWLHSGNSSKDQQAHNDDFFPEIPSSNVYTVPNSMAHIGDKSDEYARLRRDWDEKHPPDTPERSLHVMQQARDSVYDALQPPPSLPYHIFNCPKKPQPGYPHEYPTVRLLKQWPPSQSMPKDLATAHLAICVFDYGTEYTKALEYRKAEVPFVVRNDPRVAEAVERWTNDDYRSQLVGDDRVRHRAERSNSLQFLYWRPDSHSNKQPQETPNWTQPTTPMRMTYREWHQQAMKKETQLQHQSSIRHYNTAVAPYYYYRLIGCGETGPTGDCDKIETSEYLFDELTFFQPRPQQLYLTELHQQRGIHCRFGMQGVVAENHFDSSRNAIVVLGGQRRYILSHPRQCPNLALYPLEHPSARHSQLNWTDVAHDNHNAWRDTFPEFEQSMSNEVILQAGDVLYLPTNWFHSIISLRTNFQCNTRSGRTSHYDKVINECGFESK